MKRFFSLLFGACAVYLLVIPVGLFIAQHQDKLYVRGESLPFKNLTELMRDKRTCEKTSFVCIDSIQNICPNFCPFSGRDDIWNPECSLYSNVMKCYAFWCMTDNVHFLVPVRDCFSYSTLEKLFQPIVELNIPVLILTIFISFLIGTLFLVPLILIFVRTNPRTNKRKNYIEILNPDNH